MIKQGRRGEWKPGNTGGESGIGKVREEKAGGGSSKRVERARISAL